MDTVVATLLISMAFANCLLCMALASASKDGLHVLCRYAVKTRVKAVEQDSISSSSLAESIKLIDHSNRLFAGSYGLSGRETDVFILLIRGKSYAAIADELCICIATVKSHVNKIYGKMSVHSRDDLIDLVECELHSSGSKKTKLPAVA